MVVEKFEARFGGTERLCQSLMGWACWVRTLELDKKTRGIHNMKHLLFDHLMYRNLGDVLFAQSNSMTLFIEPPLNILHSYRWRFLLQLL
jgi:hypothetical protein